MTPKIAWTVLAKADLEHIYTYIREDNPAAAVAVIATIRNAVREQLATSPLSGRRGRVQGTRELVVPRLPYIVAYRVSDAQVEILRVLHAAQRWPKSF